MRDHFAGRLIGLPYAQGARGPDRFDCWGLFRFVARQELGIDLPDVFCDGTLAARVRAFASLGGGAVSAVPVDCPRELDAVYLSAHRLPHHIGVWIEPDRRKGVLHAIAGAGVVFQRVPDLAAHGLQIVAFLRLRKDPSCP